MSSKHLVLLGIGHTNAHIVKQWETVPIKPMQTFLARLAQRLNSPTTTSSTIKVAIVSGGVASVEIALCLHQQCKKRNIACDFSIKIFTSSDTVAEGMNPRSVGRIEQILQSRSIHITPGHRVTEVGDDFISTEDGSHHQADIVIWATGAAAPPVLDLMVQPARILRRSFDENVRASIRFPEAAQHRRRKSTAAVRIHHRTRPLVLAPQDLDRQTLHH